MADSSDWFYSTSIATPLKTGQPDISLTLDQGALIVITPGTADGGAGTEVGSGAKHPRDLTLIFISPDTRYTFCTLQFIEIKPNTEVTLLFQGLHWTYGVR